MPPSQSVVLSSANDNRWERRYFKALEIAPYVLLGVSLLLSQLQPNQSAGERLALIGLSALAAAWVLGMFTLPQNPNDQDIQQTVSTAIPVKAWHNHALHIERHTSQMMDEEFDTLVISHPGIVRLFDEHVAMHQQFLAQQQQQQMQMTEATKGAPGGTPAGQQQVGGVNGQQPNTALPPAQTRATTQIPDIIGGGAQNLQVRQPHPLPNTRARVQ